MNFYENPVYRRDLKEAVSASVKIEELRGKSILITGSTGTIGSFLVDLLLFYSSAYEAGITVYAAARSRKRLEECFSNPNIQKPVFVTYDMLKPVSFSFPVDYVIHAAGNAHPAAFNRDPVGTIYGTIKGTGELLEYARAQKACRFLYISSGEVYGQGDLNLEEYEETYGGYVNPMSPRSSYPNSKRAAETLCASYHKQYGLETVVLRPCHTYGPGITATDNRANAQFLKHALKGEDLVLKSACTQLRSYCYVADCASAILTVLVNGKAGEAYNCANPNARITISGFAQMVASLSGQCVRYENPTQEEKEGQTPIEKQVLSSRKLEALGWEGRFDIQRGVKHTLQILSDTRIGR